jgi:hypothetical protein
MLHQHSFRLLADITTLWYRGLMFRKKHLLHFAQGCQLLFTMLSLLRR